MAFNPVKIANVMAGAAQKKYQKKSKPAEGSPQEEASETPEQEAKEQGMKPKAKKGFPPKGFK